jgi:hypothetical protein
MRWHKKALAPETLLRVITAIILLVVVLKIGKTAVNMIAGSDAPASFNKFSNTLKDMKIESKQILVRMDESSIVYGFQNGTTNIDCKGCCTADFKDAIRPYDCKILKPDHRECKDSSCICMCLEPFIDNRGFSGQEIGCEKTLCRQLPGNLHSVRDFSKGVPENKELGGFGSSFVFSRSLGTLGDPRGYISSNEVNLLLCARKYLDNENRLNIVIGKGSECRIINEK